jgi:ribonuclease BN (tRNA processing enzyme)
VEITFIGTGSAFCTKNYHSNALVTENGKHLLIDAGGDLRFALTERGMTYKDINAVYISHFHTDHIGGLEYLAFKSFFDDKKSKIKIFINESFIEPLWENSLKAGLGMIYNQKLTIYDFFEIEAVKNSFFWENTKFELIETLHVSEKPHFLPVFGLMINAEKKVYITGDTRYLPDYLNNYYQQAEIIIHDTETSDIKSVIHSHFDDLQKFNAATKSKIYLWHYQDNVIENFNYWQQIANSNGFKGFLRKGDVIKLTMDN